MLTEPEWKLPKDLGDGLVLRRAEPADAEKLAAFDGKIHGDDAFGMEFIRAWVSDLMTRPHPTFQPADFTLVEDTRSGEIVSSLNLISQTWLYAGIPFAVGRPELVGTLPEYRSKGLVRQQFALIHEWSRQRGELAQAITGIPNYYRQFGYEMTLALGGGRVGYAMHVPPLGEGQAEPYTFRPAEEADIPWLIKMEQRARSRSLVRALRDETRMRYELFGMSQTNVNREEFRIIETAQGTPVGMLAHPWFSWGPMQPLTQYELDEGISYLAVTPSVIRYLWSVGQEYAKARQMELQGFGFQLGGEHPAYQAAADRLVDHRPQYAFYMRVPDLPAFLRKVAPVLEQRLAASAAAGYSGECKISFYRKGLRIVFDQGCLSSVEDWKPVIQKDEGDAKFPDHTFLHLLFGYRSLAEVRHLFADCSANQNATVLLEALFPKQHSSVWVIS